jgi:hypothetical protein
MTNYDRKVCQDYTHIALKLNKKDQETKQDKNKFIKELMLLVGFFLLYVIAGSITYPY